MRPADPGRVGPYVPLGLLGSGGMGRVYLARPVDGGPDLVAVKVIRPEYAEDPRFRRRFEREASVHARVRTPHTPRLCGTGFREELLWMATEYIPGLDLADVVRGDGALEAAAVWRLVAELGRALADLAAAEIVHRDLKPSNVLLSVRGAHLIDFGISKAVDASAITGTGNRVGTPAYMSPEHLRSGRSDTASDVFSLAGTLVYAAAGHAPFGDGTGVDVMHRVAFEEPDPEVIGRVTAADAALGSLLSACLSKEPERRPAPRDLIDAAAARVGTSVWPEPLGGRVLARQRAYETLQRLALERTDRSRTRDRSQAKPPVPAGPAIQPASPAGSGAPGQAAGSPAVAPAGRSRPAGARGWARKKPVLAVTAGITLGAVAAAVFVLTRQDATASASPQADVTTAVGTAPGDRASSAAPGGSDGTGGPGASGKHADGAASRPEVTGSVGAEADGDGNGDGDTGQRNDSPAPGSGTSADPPSTPSPDSPTPEPPTAPWISECTHYSGNGLTRRGNSGKRVLQVQCILTKRGYGVGSSGVDGEFGPGTESAVRSFQADKGLAVDGIVGRETWVALRGTT
ncbi:hypothetical protein GCM10023083_23490 [Streptomyces phyllanthi]